MSKTDIVYAILFVLTVPALWVLAAALDRMWPSNYERREQHQRDVAKRE
jgi:hypothetical protein